MIQPIYLLKHASDASKVLLRTWALQCPVRQRALNKQQDWWANTLYQTNCSPILMTIQFQLCWATFVRVCGTISYKAKTQKTTRPEHVIICSSRRRLYDKLQRLSVCCWSGYGTTAATELCTSALVQLHCTTSSSVVSTPASECSRRPCSNCPVRLGEICEPVWTPKQLPNC